MKTVALVSAREAIALDTDLPLLAAALARAGLGHTIAAWDDMEVRWDSFDLAVVRSTWDYVPRRDEFVAWARTLPCPVRNRAEVLEWNTDKRYLRELEKSGIPVVPTRWFEPGASHDGDLVRALKTLDTDVVVKPAISAGAKDTATYGPSEAALVRAHVERIVEGGRTAMVQPYVPGIDQRGETGLVFFGGVLSHAIHKGPLLRRGNRDRTGVTGLFAPERIDARDPSPKERALAERVLAAIPFGAPLYARVDVVDPGDDDRGHAHEPMVLELELTEPSCFLDTDEGAPDRFARAIARELGDRE